MHYEYLLQTNQFDWPNNCTCFDTTVMITECACVHVCQGIQFLKSVDTSKKLCYGHVINQIFWTGFKSVFFINHSLASSIVFRFSLCVVCLQCASFVLFFGRSAFPFQCLWVPHQRRLHKSTFSRCNKKSPSLLWLSNRKLSIFPLIGR